MRANRRGGDSGNERVVGGANPLERHGPLARPIVAGVRQDLGRGGFGPAADGVGHAHERPVAILRAALDEVAPDQPAGFDRQGRIGLEAVIPAGIAGNDGELRTAGAGERAQAVDAVGPVAGAAHHAHHDQRGAAQRLVDVEIDGERMGKLHEIGEAEARRVIAAPGRGGGKRRELAVGSGEDDDVAGRLGEIDGNLAIVDPPRLAGEEVHLAPRRFDERALTDRGASSPR